MPEGQGHSRRLADELDEIAKRCAALPVRDARTPEDILGYDEHGLPGRSGDFGLTDVTPA